MSEKRTPPMVAVRDLCKHYWSGPEQLQIRRGASFEILKGEVVSVIGHSGVGKTTLLNLLGALDRPSSGQVFLDGTKLGELPEEALAQIRLRRGGVRFQMFHL